MCSILGQVSSCLDFITLGDDEGENHIEDEDLIIKTIINLATKSTKYLRYIFDTKSLCIFFFIIN